MEPAVQARLQVGEVAVDTSSRNSLSPPLLTAPYRTWPPKVKGRAMERSRTPDREHNVPLPTLHTG